MKYLIAGIVGGIIGGMGMGGGTLLIPILTVILGMEQRSAQLINIISFIPMAIITIIINTKSHLIKWQHMLYVSVSGSIAAIVSSFFSGKIDGALLGKLFGAFLIVLGLYFIISTIVKAVKTKRNETLVSINVKKNED